ncbi:MAG: hypothetical protein OXC68_08615 [Aestuariivita sp.]|nr:hypothetical protein [Aestuariivita sp.]
MGIKTTNVITACAGTVIAALAVVGVTAAAQEYVLGRERDVAIEIYELSSNFSALKSEFDDFQQGQAYILKNMLTKAHIDNILQEFLAKISSTSQPTAAYTPVPQSYNFAAQGILTQPYTFPNSEATPKGFVPVPPGYVPIPQQWYNPIQPD